MKSSSNYRRSTASSNTQTTAPSILTIIRACRLFSLTCVSICTGISSSPLAFATSESLPPSFLGITRQDPGAPLCIAGIPYDLGTSNRPGSRFGPSAIRRASRMLVDGEHPLHWVNPASAALADIGDFSIALGDIAKSLAEIERQACEIAHLVALGGDHGITLPLLRALAKKRGAPALIHLDAHVDTRYPTMMAWLLRRTRQNRSPVLLINE